MSEKLCVFCNYGDFTGLNEHGDYPDPSRFECNKGHELRLHGFISDIDDFRKVITQAATCPDYDQVTT